MSWIDEFLADGPEYVAEARSVQDIQDLLLRAGLGVKLPLDIAADFAGMAALLMSDPSLFAMAVAALEGPHLPVRVEGTLEHKVIDGASIVMAAPQLSAAFVGGATRVVLHGLAWPQLLWPLLLRIEQVYGFASQVSRPDAHTVMVSKTTTGMARLAAPQPVPLIPLARLKVLAVDAPDAAGAG